jgi:cytidylate kinase
MTHREAKSLRRCEAFIRSNFMEPPAGKVVGNPPALTVSRLAFSGAHEIAERFLQRPESQGWALFDRELVHRILKDHDLPETLARYMPEDRDHNLSGLINEVLGVHPSQWELFHYTCDTILKLAEVGRVILIGRGSHIITRELQHVRHIRIQAPMDYRIRRAARQLDIADSEARRRIRQLDSASEAYVRSHFDESLSNPECYDLTINTGRVGLGEAAGLLERLVLGD